MTDPTVFSTMAFPNGATIRNRIVLAPLTTEQSNEDGSFSEEELNWLDMRAEGGFGMLITAACSVRADGQTYSGQIGCFADAHDEGLRAFADQSSAQGALSILQLVHGGLRSNPSITGLPALAPSAVDLDFPGFRMPDELDDAGIEDLIDSFARSALRAERAGMSGIELHAANGYIFTQFLSRITNVRTDKWGGSNVNRARFLVRTIAAIRAAVDTGFILGVRLRAEDILPNRGFDLDDTLELVAGLGGRGITYVHLAAASISARSWRRPDAAYPNLRVIRDALHPDIALVANGDVRTAGDAEAALIGGADLVALGKTAISTPDWPRRVAEPDFVPPVFPLPSADLAAAGVSPRFMKYLEGFRLVET